MLRNALNGLSEWWTPLDYLAGFVIVCVLALVVYLLIARTFGRQER